MSGSLIRLQALMLGVDDVRDFLRELAALASEVVDPQASCGITMCYDGQPMTVISNDALAESLDESQYEAGDGPCLQALRTGQSVPVEDVATEQRWPAYTRSARDSGLRSSLSLPLTVHGQTVGAMNLYAFHAPRAFDDDQRQRCATFAAQAAGAFQLVVQRDRNTDLLSQLESALSSRTVIDQAIGITMSRGRCSPEEAFGRLRTESQGTQRKLRDIAAQLVADTGRAQNEDAGRG